jgi:hypothetical protein
VARDPSKPAAPLGDDAMAAQGVGEAPVVLRSRNESDSVWWDRSDWGGISQKPKILCGSSTYNEHAACSWCKLLVVGSRLNWVFEGSLCVEAPA